MFRIFIRLAIINFIFIQSVHAIVSPKKCLDAISNREIYFNELSWLPRMSRVKLNVPWHFAVDTRYFRFQDDSIGYVSMPSLNKMTHLNNGKAILVLLNSIQGYLITDPLYQSYFVDGEPILGGDGFVRFNAGPSGYRISYLWKSGYMLNAKLRTPNLSFELIYEDDKISYKFNYKFRPDPSKPDLHQQYIRQYGEEYWQKSEYKKLGNHQSFNFVESGNLKDLSGRRLVTFSLVYDVQKEKVLLTLKLMDPETNIFSYETIEIQATQPN